MEVVRALYFTDVLCVWAYLNQVRIDELRKELGQHVQVDPRFCSVFGNVPAKLVNNWAHRGGAGGYAAHVGKVVASYGHVTLHPNTWAHVQPNSSTPAHLLLCALRLLERDGHVAPGCSFEACWAMREAFFKDGRNVAHQSVLFEIAESLRVDRTRLQEQLESGLAFAELAADFELVREYDIKLSPSLILNEGRQRLNGNVGFRVIEANVKELMHVRREQEASWC